MNSKTAKKIKSKNSEIEMLLGKAMWSKGLIYRKNCKDVFGKPDIVFHKQKIAIFCDGEFWHGQKYLEDEHFKTNADCWGSRNKKRYKFGY